jgi:Na+-driven multidrug efflux pump
MVAALTLYVFSAQISGVFTDDPIVLRAASLYFRIVSFTYIFANLIPGWGSAFNAIGRPERSFLMIVIRMVAVMIPAVYAGHLLYGVMGIFCAMAAVNVLTGIGFHLWSWRTFRQRAVL